MKKLANKIRKKLLIMNSRSFASHSGSALSIVDILVVLYFKILNISPNSLSDPKRDKLILSKGHGSSALYVTLAEKNFFDKSLLDKFYLDGGKLPGHLDRESVPGIEVSSGSLGHGLSLGLGMALANSIDLINSRVFVISGDGELNEGSIWEAIMLAGHLKQNNLTLIIDNNKLQGYGKTSNILNLEPLDDKFKVFNWEVIQIDGHNYEEIEKAFKLETDKPKVIIAKTIKGKGVSYMENKFEWHYKSPNKEQLKQALEELI